MKTKTNQKLDQRALIRKETVLVRPPRLRGKSLRYHSKTRKKSK